METEYRAVSIPKNLNLNRIMGSFEDLRITDRTQIEPPEPIIMIGQSLISTRGNITTISGASKSGKSAFTSWILVGAISDGEAETFENLSVYPNADRKAVIHIDTEQARHKQQGNVNSIIERAGLSTCQDFYLSYNLRQLDLSEYKDITSKICQEAVERFGGIHLIVIDGIADYIRDVNDGTESNEIVKYFMDLAEQFKTPVVTIVHTNPGSDKERGHLGSQCQRKSESVLIVKNDGNVSVVEPRFLREAGMEEMPRIKFCYDGSKGYHVSCGTGSTSAEKKQAQRKEELEYIAERVFEENASYRYAELIERIMKTAERRLATSKGLAKEMISSSIIIQNPDRTWQLKSKQ